MWFFLLHVFHVLTNVLYIYIGFIYGMKLARDEPEVWDDKGTLGMCFYCLRVFYVLTNVIYIYVLSTV